MADQTTGKEGIPSTLRQPASLRFWTAIVITGALTGFGAAALTRLLYVVQRFLWGDGSDLLTSAMRQPWTHRVAALLCAGLVTGLGQLIVKRLSSGNGIDITAAIWFHAGRLPAFRTLCSAVLSVVVVGMGVSLGREGAPKQAGAVWANWLADVTRLSDEQRRLLVACGAGAGMASVYGVPLGGALFALEVMRGVLALRYVLPSLVTSLVATGIAWIFLPDARTYNVPAFHVSPIVFVWVLVAGPVAGVFSVGYVKAIAWAEHNKPKDWRRVAEPLGVLGALGVLSIWFPQLLGNGKDISELAFSGAVGSGLLFTLLLLKPLATILCVRCGAPGGLFTPSLTAGAMLGGVLGSAWSFFFPGTENGLFCFLGAGAVLAATTQGPLSTVVLLMELTGRDRSFALPLILITSVATLVARTIEPRSVYDAKLTDEEVEARQEMRERIVLVR